MNVETKRFLAGLIDHAVGCIAISLVNQVLALFGITQIGIVLFVSAAVYFLVILLKDICLNNASIGKRILKLKVVSATDEDLTFWRYFKRTITLILVPVEIILAISKNERIGDIWAKTAVVEAI